jgi:hypothetical protein
VESGEWKVGSGEWGVIRSPNACVGREVGSGKWGVESGEWRVESDS